jgi:hypothetical protein
MKTPSFDVLLITVVSKKGINVSGVTFDSELLWTSHILKPINKANKTLTAIKTLRKFFNTTELLLLLTSNYNSEIWHLASLTNPRVSSSANALKVTLHYPNSSITFFNLRKKMCYF